MIPWSWRLPHVHVLLATWYCSRFSPSIPPLPPFITFFYSLFPPSFFFPSLLSMSFTSPARLDLHFPRKRRRRRRKRRWCLLCVIWSSLPIGALSSLPPFLPLSLPHFFILHPSLLSSLILHPCLAPFPPSLLTGVLVFPPFPLLSLTVSRPSLPPWPHAPSFSFPSFHPYTTLLLASLLPLTPLLRLRQLGRDQAPRPTRWRGRSVAGTSAAPCRPPPTPSFALRDGRVKEMKQIASQFKEGEK